MRILRGLLRKAEIVIFGLEIDERAVELVFDHLPHDAGHLVAVHLDERQILHDFHGNGALARGYLRIVERMNEGVAVLF